MALKDVLVPEPPKERKNAVEKILEKLDAEDTRYLLDCLANPAFSNIYLAAKLTEAGYPISEASVARHRNRLNK